MIVTRKWLRGMASSKGGIMALHIRGNVATLADFGLLQAARPVLARQKDILRKRTARKVAAQERERERNLTIVCADGRLIRPIK